MRLAWLFVLAACVKKPAVHPSGETGTGTSTSGSTEPAGEGTTAPAHGEATSPGRKDIPVPNLVIGMALRGSTLVWNDLTGTIWTMPSDGSAAPKRLSEQHKDGFVFRPFLAGNRVLAKVDKDLVEISMPDGPVTRAHIKGIAGLPEEACGNDTAAFITVFKQTAVLKVAGGAAQRVLDVARGVLGLHGDTLYVASYSLGTLQAVPVAGGAPKQITKGLARPTVVVADDHAAYLHTEGDHRVIRVDLASGAQATLGEHLENADVIVLDGSSLYTVSWPHNLVRLSTTPGTPPATLASDLEEPRSIAVDSNYVYVTTANPPRIVRIKK